MTTAEILRAARALIDTPEKWAKHGDAFDDECDEVEVDDPNAVCWCAGGAIARVAPNPAAPDAFHVLASVMGTVYPYQFNDRPETTHADVMAAFDRAIAAEEATA